MPTVMEAKLGGIALEDFLKQHYRLVWGYVHRIAREETFKDDLFQLGLIKVNEAVNEFNPDLGVKFITFATDKVKYEIMNAYNRKFKPKKDMIYLDEVVDVGSQDRSKHEYIEDVKDMYISSEIKTALRSTISCLNDKYKSVINLFISGRTQQEISKILNIPDSTVCHIVKQFRSKLTLALAS